MSGPLKGTRIIEIAAIGPVPFCGMLLADMGADVIVVHRPGSSSNSVMSVTERGKRSLILDLKKTDDAQRLLKLCTHADALIEGYRPGVMERLGVGPDPCLQRNPKLVYGRVSGWGQTGPMANAASHDINFLAMGGILDIVRDHNGHPVLPANLIGDYGAGSMYMAFGLLCGLLEAQKSGKGQVIDLAVSEATSSLATIFFGGGSSDFVRKMLSGNAHFYQVYATSDGHHVSIGAIEPQFYAAFLKVMGLTEDPSFADQMDRDLWPKNIETLRVLFGKATRAEWTQRFANVDACFMPVNLLEEVPEHPQMKARNAFVEVDGQLKPAPTPRFSRTPSSIPSAPKEPGSDTAAILAEFDL